jgi:hypothetical protein
VGARGIVETLKGVQGILIDLSASACYAERHCIEHRRYNKFEKVPKNILCTIFSVPR